MQWCIFRFWNIGCNKRKKMILWSDYDCAYEVLVHDNDGVCFSKDAWCWSPGVVKEMGEEEEEKNINMIIFGYLVLHFFNDMKGIFKIFFLLWGWIWPFKLKLIKFIIISILSCWQRNDTQFIGAFKLNFKIKIHFKFKWTVQFINHKGITIYI